VMIDFYAEWCAPCKELELIFARPGVYERIVEAYVPLKFDVTQPTDENFDLQDRYGAHALPSVIFLDAEGNELGRITSQRPSESGVHEALDGLRKDQTASDGL
jgi:thioredoxin:protein disulfide reductase